MLLTPQKTFWGRQCILGARAWKRVHSQDPLLRGSFRVCCGWRRGLLLRLSESPRSMAPRSVPRLVFTGKKSEEMASCKGGF